MLTSFILLVVNRALDIMINFVNIFQDANLAVDREVLHWCGMVKLLLKTTIGVGTVAPLTLLC